MAKRPVAPGVDGLYTGEVLWWALLDTGSGWDTDRYMLAVDADGSVRFALADTTGYPTVGEGTGRYTLLEAVDVPTRTLPSPGRDMNETYSVPRTSWDAEKDPQPGDAAWYRDVEYPWNAEYGAFVRPPNPKHGTLPIQVRGGDSGVRVYPTPGSTKSAVRVVRQK